MKIVLVGYMGSGKSTVGKLLAAKRNLKFIDLDAYIEAAEGENPLIANVSNAEMPEFIGKHLFERSFFYNKAHHTILVKEETATEVLQVIQQKLV